ncbi:MAG: Efflux ABC transporter, ATP-binding protein, partial [uncultured Rubrobacteraceae bacterium]
ESITAKRRGQELQEAAEGGGALARRGLSGGGQGRGRGDPRSERKWKEHAGACDLHARAARRRVGRGLRHGRRQAPQAGAAEHEPGKRRGELLQEIVRDGEFALRGQALRRDEPGGAAQDQGHPGEHRLRPEAGDRAHGAPEPRHAAEDSARESAPHEPGPDAPRRADDGTRPQEQEGRAGVYQQDQGGSRLLDPALHPRHGRGRGAVRPGGHHDGREDPGAGEARGSQAPLLDQRPRADPGRDFHGRDRLLGRRGQRGEGV